MRKITIKLDHLPNSSLLPNRMRREHWSARHYASSQARQEMSWLAKIQWKDQEPMQKARISVEFLVKDKRKHDADGLLSALKPSFDGLVDVGVLIDDDMKHLEYGLIRATYGDKDQTIINVAEIE